MEIARREFEDCPDSKFDLMKTYKRKSSWNKKNTPELKAAFYHWLITKCDRIRDSPDRRDMQRMKDENDEYIIEANSTKYGEPDPETGKIKEIPNTTKYMMERKYFYKGSKLSVYLDAIKEPRLGGFEGFRDPDTNEVCIHRSTFEKLMPDNIRHFSQSRKQGCMCTACQNALIMHTDLKANRGTRKRSLERKLAKLANSPRTGISHEAKDKLQRLTKLTQDTLNGFLQDAWKKNEKGEWVQKYQTMDDAMAEMTCPTVADTGLCPYKCCLQRCTDCPPLRKNRGEESMKVPDKMEDGYEMITWWVHENRNACALHGQFVNDKKGCKGKCPQCEALPPEQRSTTAVKKTLDPVKKTLPIGKFMLYYEGHISSTWRQHNWQRTALGSGYCKKFRDPEVILVPGPEEETDPEVVFLLDAKYAWDMHCVCDYTDRVQCSYNMSNQSGEIARACKNIGMEGFLYSVWNYRKKCVETHWQGYLSDWKQQDSRTSYINTLKFVRMLIKKGYLRPGSTLWMQSDGCAKQYKCANAAWMNIIIAQAFEISIDWMITTAGHGKCLVDSMAGTDKHHLMNGYLDSKLIDPTRIKDDETLSEAVKACDFLKREDWPLGDSKPERKDGSAQVASRNYEVSNYDIKDIPFKNCSFEVAGGSDTGKSKTPEGQKNGIKEMFHFRYNGRLPTKMAVIRRIPCACRACHKQLSQPWVENLEVKAQPMLLFNLLRYFMHGVWISELAPVRVCQCHPS